MGSDSDLSVMQAAADILKQFDISHEVTVVSAHRTPLRMVEYAQKAKERGLKVIIAGAGGAAHLPGMVASITSFLSLVFLSNHPIPLMAGILYFLFCKCRMEYRWQQLH